MDNYKLMILGVITFSGITLTSSTNDWKPILSSSIQERKLVEERFILPGNLGHYDSSLIGSNSIVSGFHQNEQCSIRKVSFDQEGYYQYMEYTQKIPDLKEFTLCMWIKFENHSTDHPLFSYSVGDQNKEIQSWVSNTQTSSFISLAVHGLTFYRLNYPFKQNSWYHSCQSWNGKTGEWQIWVNSERIGRGFYNRLVGHVIKGGGHAITGQNHQTLSGEVNEHFTQQNSRGMMGEITMLQLYRVALTAGKAHKDHKHHHVNRFDHNGAPVSPPPPQAPQINNFMRGQQLPHMLTLNLAYPGLVKSQSSEGVNYNAEFANGQFDPSRSVTEQLINAYVKSMRGQIVQQPKQQTSDFVFPTDVQQPSLSPFFSNEYPSGAVQFLDPSVGGRFLYKRDNKETEDQSSRSKRDNLDKELSVTDAKEGEETPKKNVKRGLLLLTDGTLIDEENLNFDSLTFEQSLLNGLAGTGQNLPVQNIQKEKSHDREPAEAEVKAVMNVCDGCTEEPFEKALVLSWRHTSLNLHHGTVLQHALPVCSKF